MSPLTEQLLALPKIELHNHFESAISVKAAMELMTTPGIFGDLWSEAAVKRYFSVSSKDQLPDKLQRARMLIRNLADLEFYLEAIIANCKEQNIRALELIINPMDILANSDISADELVASLNTAATTSGVQLGWIVELDAMRGVAGAKESLNFISQHSITGLVGVGLVSIDAATTRADYVPFLRSAVDNYDLGVSIHAGEFSGPRSIWQVVDIFNELGTNKFRIAHGITAASDERLMQTLRELEITLDLAITSNFSFGLVPKGEAHPLVAIANAGVNYTFGTDNLLLFGGQLSPEYELALKELQLSSASDAKTFVENAVKASFFAPAISDAIVTELANH